MELLVSGASMFGEISSQSLRWDVRGNFGTWVGNQVKKPPIYTPGTLKRLKQASLFTPKNGWVFPWGPLISPYFQGLLLLVSGSRVPSFTSG